MPLQFYGKKTCITCQKAKAYLHAQKIALVEFPIETQPPDRKMLERLIDPNNVKTSLNSRSAIYKQKNLGQNLPDQQTAIALMLEDPNLIKRPVLVDEAGNLYQGFDEASLTAFLNQ